MNKLKKLTVEESAYIAGFLDGDGCVNAQLVRRKDYILGFQIRVSITFFQKSKNYWFLIWLDKQLDCGYLRNRPDDMSEYAIVGISSVQNLLTQLRPYCKLKKRQISLLLEIIEKMPKSKKDPLSFLKLCEKVDLFAVLNYSKQRKITTDTVRSHLGF